jgi:hypothetical protein
VADADRSEFRLDRRQPLHSGQTAGNVSFRLLTVNQLVRVIDRCGAKRTLPRSKNLKNSSLKELLAAAQAELLRLYAV